MQKFLITFGYFWLSFGLLVLLGLGYTRFFGEDNLSIFTATGVYLTVIFLLIYPALLWTSIKNRQAARLGAGIPVLILGILTTGPSHGSPMYLIWGAILLTLLCFWQMPAIGEALCRRGCRKIGLIPR